MKILKLTYFFFQILFIIYQPWNLTLWKINKTKLKRKRLRKLRKKCEKIEIMRGKRAREDEVDTINPNKKKCRCGSFTHLRTNSKLCSLNQFNIIESSTADSSFINQSIPTSLNQLEISTHEQYTVSPNINFINDLRIASPNLNLTPVTVKRKRICRCGETSHCTATSFLCKLNPNSPNFVPLTRTQTNFQSFCDSPDKYTSISKPKERRNILHGLQKIIEPQKRCRCGSIDHSRVNHSSCILNKKNRHNLSSEAIQLLEKAHAARNSNDSYFDIAKKVNKIFLVV